MELDPKGASRDLIDKTSKEIVETVILKFKRNYSDQEMREFVKDILNKMMREMLAIARTIKQVSPEQKS